MNNNYYGDNTRWFIADVIDATPPYGFEGRVRVRIHGVHSPSTQDIRQADLPWAQCVLPVTEGGVSGLGMTPKLEAGALVFGFFMDGKESQVPIIMGSLPRIEYPTPVQQSLAFQDLIQRVNPNVEFYNQSISSIDENDESLDNESREDSFGFFSSTKTYRRDTAVKFFLSNGYTIKQSCALVGAISFVNPEFNTNYVNKGGTGLMGWSGVRFKKLKQFDNAWWKFTSQLSFILYELNTTHVDANVRILNSDVIDPEKGKALGDIIARYYAPIKGLYSWSYNKEAKKIYQEYQNKLN